MDLCQVGCVESLIGHRSALSMLSECGSGADGTCDDLDLKDRCTGDIEASVIKPVEMVRVEIGLTGMRKMKSSKNRAQTAHHLYYNIQSLGADGLGKVNL